jgi:catechol 2,3-dioxygenase-like lactoylglutathione lyase family enzyme
MSKRSRRKYGRANSWIHHVTAIAGDPQTNIDFYAGILGWCVVKLRVNFDDPGTYHLYYGDGVGHPCTIVMFFPLPHAPQGRRGTGQVTETAFAVSRPRDRLLGRKVFRPAHRVHQVRPIRRAGTVIE